MNHRRPNTTLLLPWQYGGQPRLSSNYLETSHNHRIGVFLVFPNLIKVPAVSTHHHHRHLLLPVTATHSSPSMPSQDRSICLHKCQRCFLGASHIACLTKAPESPLLHAIHTLHLEWINTRCTVEGTFVSLYRNNLNYKRKQTRSFLLLIN